MLIEVGISHSLVMIILPRNIITADESLLQISGNLKLLEKLRLFLVTCFFFFLRYLPSVVPFANPNSKRGFKFTSEKKLKISDCAELGIGRAIWQLLSDMNEISVNSRKYEVVRSLAEKLIDENHGENSIALFDLNPRVLNASFRRTLSRLEVAVGNGFTGWGGEKTVDQSSETADKLAAELLWLAEKMAVYGFVDEAVEKWASASNLAWLALWSEPRLQCSLVQISADIMMFFC